MTVIVEFSLPADSFPFGRSTSGDPSVRVQLERPVPLREDRIPFLWAAGQAFDQFEDHLRNSDIVKDVGALTRIGDSVLYYTEWYTDKESFLNGVSDTNGTIIGRTVTATGRLPSASAAMPTSHASISTIKNTTSRSTSTACMRLLRSPGPSMASASRPSNGKP